MTSNEKIAKFMGYKLSYIDSDNTMPYWNHNDKYIKPKAIIRIDKGEKFEFDTSWDWLMPACKKWDDLPLSKFTGVQKKEYGKLCDELDHLVSCYELTPAYNHFVKCVDWYKTQKV